MGQPDNDAIVKFLGSDRYLVVSMYPEGPDGQFVGATQYGLGPIEDERAVIGAVLVSRALNVLAGILGTTPFELASAILHDEGRSFTAFDLDGQPPIVI